MRLPFLVVIGPTLLFFFSPLPSSRAVCQGVRDLLGISETVIECLEGMKKHFKILKASLLVLR